MRIDVNKRDMVVIVLIVILLTLLLSYVYVTFIKIDASVNIKKNQYNKYDINYITVDKQASYYLDQYYNLLLFDMKKAYKLLDEKTKKIYSTEEEYTNYINTLDLSNTSINLLRTYTLNKQFYYDIYDGNNNHFIFKTKGVAQYSVIIKQ